MRANRSSGAAILATAVVLAAMSVAPSSVAAERHGGSSGVAGAAGSGDPYFPLQGNGGYDVASYDLHISYARSTKHLAGSAHITARATQSLWRFDLDLRRNMVVSSVRVDGQPTPFSQPAAQKQELVVAPKHLLLEGKRFQVDVDYAGTVKAVIDPDTSLDGFIPTGDGAFVASEPQGSPSWFPVNDTPNDKATYAVSITVSKGLAAISNGALESKVTHGGRTTWSWRLTHPVSSYLVTATIGKFTITTGHTPGGVPYLDAVDPAQQAATTPVLKKLPAIIDYFSSVYGPYPFGRAGAIVDNATQVGYALETATRPVFDRAPDIATLSHELAHQWYGDDVTLHRWRDIWLNEGFAEFSSWLWDEHSGGTTAAQHLSALLALPATKTDEWLPPPGNPGAADSIFSNAVYDRGAGTLEALRQKVGNRTFFTIMRGWLAAHRYGNATDGQFTAYAAKVAHRNLDHFFYEWLYRKGKPQA